MAEAPDRQELLTALTTEHFTLQGARSQTASESASRASLYILSVSSAVVALGFIGQASQIGTTFDVFALTVLPTLYVLGVFTFVRVVECGAEDFRYGVAINRIRNYYKQIAGDQSKLFLLSGHDDGRGVFENAAVPPERRKQFFTFATVVAVINSVVGGSAIALALGAIADTSLGVAAAWAASRRSSPSSLCSVTPTGCSRSARAAPSRSSRRRGSVDNCGSPGCDQAPNLVIIARGRRAPFHRRCPDRTTSPAPRGCAPYSTYARVSRCRESISICRVGVMVSGSRVACIAMPSMSAWSRSVS